MNDQMKMTRGQFLAAIGSIGLAAVLFKLSAVKHTVTMISKKTGTTNPPGAYGNHAYGGKTS